MSRLQEAARLITFFISIAAPTIALVIIMTAFISLRYGRREKHALVTLEDTDREILYPVLFWENSIGRSRTSDIRIKDPTVSREHAVLLRRSNGWFIADTGSKAGVYVNGQQAQGRTPVYIGDQIRLGLSVLTLRRADDTTAYSEREYLRYKEAKRESRTVTGSVLLMLITVYILFLTAEAVLNMNSFAPVIAPLGFVTVMWIFYAVSRRFFKRRCFELEALAFLLSGTGIILNTVHDQRQSFVQLAALVLGIIIYCFMLWFIEVPDRVMKWRWLIAVGALGMLGLTIAIGTNLNGAKNWIVLGPVSVQPAEFVKIAYIFIGASTLDYLQTRKNLFGFILVSGMYVGVLVLMSDFGTAVIFFATFLVIAFMRSGDFKTIILAVTAAALAVIVVLSVKPYIAARFQAWGHVWEYATEEGYQQVNTLIYSSSGGLFGVGLSKGCLQYVFASESDLVFGLATEELGLIIAVLCGVVIGGLMLYARAVITRSRSTFYSIAACSAAGLLVFQAALNIFGVVDLLPLTGVTLPFVSYGGSSMAACWGLLAFIKSADERTYSHRHAKTVPADDDDDGYERSDDPDYTDYTEQAYTRI